MSRKFWGAALLWFGASTAHAAIDDAIVLTLEEPATGAVYASIRNVRGWAVAPTEIRSIELFVDGELHGSIPMGALRNDVAEAFPGYAGAAKSGFSMIYNYGNLDQGHHRFTVRAIDADGHYNERRAEFTVTGFHYPFLAKSTSFFEEPIDLSQAVFSADGPNIHIVDMLVEEGRYEVTLSWSTAAQGFVFTSIEQYSPPSECGPGGLCFSPMPPRPSPAAGQYACPSYVGLELEEPATGATYASVENIRGWAVATGGMDRIELYLDNRYVTDVPYGGQRDDVASAFADGCPAAVDAGFSMAYHFPKLGPGTHSIEIRGYARTGAEQSLRRDFQVAGFGGNRFLESGVVIDLGAARIRALDLKTIEVAGALVDNAFYTLQLQWTPAKQAFSLVRIDAMPTP